MSNTHGRLGNARKPDREVARMVVVMIVAFMVGWTPYAAFSITVTACPTIHIDPRLGSIPAFFSKTAAVYNPIIYVFMNKQVCLCHLSPLSGIFGSLTHFIKNKFRVPCLEKNLMRGFCILDIKNRFVMFLCHQSIKDIKATRSRDSKSYMAYI